MAINRGVSHLILLGETLCNDNVDIVEPTNKHGVKGLEACSFEISCDSSITHADVRYYTITSTGSCVALQELKQVEQLKFKRVVLISLLFSILVCSHNKSFYF